MPVACCWLSSRPRTSPPVPERDRQATSFILNYQCKYRVRRGFTILARHVVGCQLRTVLRGMHARKPCRRAARHLRRKTMKFLIVDDDPIILQLMKAVLEEAGHSVKCFDSSLKALREIPVYRPDSV